MSGAERQRKWMEKNRAVHNLRRRNARKKDLSLGEQEPERESTVPRIEMAQDSKQEKLAALRKMIEEPQENPLETSVEAPPTVYRNDYGGVISKFQWEKLQRLKEHAKENNFEIDEYSQ